MVPLACYQRTQRVSMSMLCRASANERTTSHRLRTNQSEAGDGIDKIDQNIFSYQIFTSFKL